jgi:hypothetical protein
MKRSRVAASLAGLAGLALTAGLVMSAAPAQAAPCGTGGTTFTTTHLGSGQQSTTDSNNWGGGNACLTVPGTDQAHAGAFTVQSQTTAETGGVLAAPETMIGCRSGNCTFASGLPKAVSAGVNPSVTWSYSLSGVVAGTKSDEEINANFSANCSGTSTPVANAVLGIYLNATLSYSNRGLPSSGTQVSIDGTNWYTLKVNKGTYWKMEFSRVTPTTTGVTSLSIGGFVNWIESNWGTTVLPTTDCMTEIDTDNEIWAAGAGFASTGTSMTAP